MTEHDLGVEIDLINPETYHVPIEMQGHLILEPEDEKLIEEEAITPQNTKRSINHQKAVPWLKKTEYISTEFNRYGASSEKNETKVGYKIKKDMKDDNLYLDRESQITAIDKTFEEAKKPIIEHHNKKGVVPVEILPVYPDFELWKYPFAQVQFDSEPASTSQLEEMSQAMIRGVMDESGEQFVAYFLPTEETINKRKLDEEEEREYLDECEYEYKMAREYNWNVKSKATKGYEENYFFIFRDDSMVYNELETRVRLTKRRAKAGVHQTNSKLIVKHRSLIDVEMKQQEIRLKSLEPPQDEDEEIEDILEQVEHNAEAKESDKESNKELSEKESNESSSSSDLD